MMKLRISRNCVFLLLLFVQNVVRHVVIQVAGASQLPANDVSTDDASNHHQLNRMIQDVLKSSEQQLKAYEQHTSTAETLESSMSETLDHLQILSKQLAQLETTRDQLINYINSQEMKELQDRFENIYQLVVENRNTSVVENENIHAPTERTTATVTISELERRLIPENLLSESESILSEWIRSIIIQEIDELDVNLLISSLATTQHSKLSSDSSKDCISVETAAEEVYFGLMRYVHDGIGLMDYAHSIVHEYTSPTYVMTNDDVTSTPTLSAVWWNRYIPQDWEYLLPHGWKDWKVWSFNLPDHIYHSLGGWSWSGSIGRGPACAPPEAILQSSTLPGQCWPVAMIAKPAIVTIRLQPSIVVTAISIDHMSKLFFSKFKQQLNSAPKRLMVYGYTPCLSCSINCDGIGFDIESKTLLGEFTYKLVGENNIQTFPIGHTNKDGAAQMPNAVEGSCSATATSEACSARNSRATAAVTLEILDNWGNEDYTCLYRIRVHGELDH